NKITLQKIINLANEEGFTIEKPVYLEKAHRFKTKELKHLSDNLYAMKSTKYEQNVENLELFLAKNEYSEIEEVAKKIDNLVRNNNLRYKDIAIITKNIET